MAGEDTLGEAVLKLSTNNKKLKSDVGKAKKTATGMQTHFTKVAGAIGAAFAAIGIAAVARQVLAATETQERAERILESTIRATGMAAGFTADQLKIQAAALQEVTTVGDESILTLQNSLLAFRNISGKVFTDLTALILDFAAATGRKAARAARMLGKAINDPISSLTVLRDIGLNLTPVFEENIRKMVELGDVSGAQTALIRELEKSFGGAAAAAKDTLGGAITSLSNTFGDLFLEMGKGKTGPLAELINGIAARLPQAFAITQGVIAGFLSVLSSMWENMKVVITAATLFTMAMVNLGMTLYKVVTNDIKGAGENLRIAGDLFKAAGSSALEIKGPLDIAAEAGRALSDAYTLAMASTGGLTEEQKRLAFQAAETAQAVADAAMIEKGIIDRFVAQNKFAADEIARIDASRKASAKSTASKIASANQSAATSFGALAGQMATQGAKMQDVMKQLIKTAIQLALKMAVIKGVMGAASGGFLSGAVGSFGGFFAEGGTLQPGEWGIAGENGPEPIFAGSAPLQVASAGAPAGGGGGDTYHITNNVAANDITDERTLGRLFDVMTSATKAGLSQAKDAAGAFSDSAALNPERA